MSGARRVNHFAHDHVRSYAEQQEAAARARLYRQKAFAPAPQVAAFPSLRIPLGAIVSTTAAHFHLSVEALRVGTATHFTMPRQIGMFIATQITGHTCTEIGAAFGRSRHPVEQAKAAATKRLLKLEPWTTAAVLEITTKLQEMFPNAIELPGEDA